MKNKISSIIIAILLAVIWFKGCSKFQNGTNSQSNNHQIKIPEIKGKFKPKTDIPTILIDTQYLDKLVKVQDLKLISDITKLYNENQKLQNDFLKETDSLKRIIMFNKATKLSEFYKEFENDTINILIKGIVQGEVKQIQPFYTIKERKQSISIPEVKFRLLAGGSVGNTLDFQNPLFSAGIGFQNKKGSILLGSFDTEKRISIGYYQSIFSIKK